MGTGRSTTKYYRRGYYKNRTTKQLQSDNTAMILLLVIAGPFTYGISWLALFFLLISGV